MSHQNEGPILRSLRQGPIGLSAVCTRTGLSQRQARDSLRRLRASGHVKLLEGYDYELTELGRDELAGPPKAEASP